MLQVSRAPGQCPFDVRQGLAVHREQVDAWRGIHRTSDIISGEVLGDAKGKNPDLPTYDPKACRMHVDATWRESGGSEIDVRSADDKSGTLWLRLLMDKAAGVGVLVVGNDGTTHHAAITVPLGDLTRADETLFKPEFFQSKTPLQHVRISQPQSLHAPVSITLNDEAPLSLPCA